MSTPRTRPRSGTPTNGTRTRQPRGILRPFIKRYVRYDHTTLEDLFAVMAANVEDAFLLTGAEPGKDYTHRDCFTLAAPLVLSMFHDKTTEITFCLEWPAYADEEDESEEPGEADDEPENA